jgi:hypothetical protein
MNQDPQQYYPQQYTYYHATLYWTAQLQDLIPVVVGIAMMVAVGAWALSLVKKAFRGEEVKFPL